MQSPGSLSFETSDAARFAPSNFREVQWTEDLGLDGGFAADSTQQVHTAYGVESPFTKVVRSRCAACGSDSTRCIFVEHVEFIHEDHGMVTHEFECITCGRFTSYRRDWESAGEPPEKDGDSSPSERPPVLHALQAEDEAPW